MKNEEFLDNLNNKENKAKRNKSDDGALLEVEEKINKLKHTPEVASENFQNELKMKILEKRRTKKLYEKYNALIFLEICSKVS